MKVFEFDVRVRKVRGFCSSSSSSSNLKNNLFEFEVRVREKFLFDPSLVRVDSHANIQQTHRTPCADAWN